MTSAFADAVLAWYDQHGRRLPWRGARDPYRIWIAEVMLQQTQVETVKPYYRRWLRRFPTMRALAQAPLEAVLAQWEGLGYYTRARNLHRAARQLVHERAGRLPASVDELRGLPGIGRYTAAAIASIAFNVAAAVLDGNVKRVLARVFNYTGDIKTPRGEQDLWALAERLLPPDRPGDYNQAVMDLGATVCTPRAPDCAACPLGALCQARQQGIQLALPATTRRPRPPLHHLAVGVVRRRGRVLLVQRPPEALLGGLWAFPAARLDDGASARPRLRQTLRADYGLQAQIGAPTQCVRHAYTHFRVVAQAYDCVWTDGRPRPSRAGERVKWVAITALADYPMGKVDRRIAQALAA